HIAFSQDNFNVQLILDYSSAEQTIQLYEDQPVSTETLAELRGNLIAAFTTGLIANRRSVTDLLQPYLDSLKYHQIIRDDTYHLEEARKNVVAIKELFQEIKKRNFHRRIVATVEQIFPQDVRVNISIPIYVVALGHENVDAYVRRIIWHGDAPQFVGEDSGELTIVINLAHSVHYGDDLEERFISLLGVVAHEVFHAAFGAYKDNSPTWKQYYRKHRNPFNDLLDLTQNEGIAYYLSLDQSGRGYLPRDWYNRTKEAFSTFNKNASELLSDKLAPQRISEILRTANLSGYWESYGSMTGMFMAREIDIRSGRQELIETISQGPVDFLKKYAQLTNQDGNLHKLSQDIIQAINKND
ncbi:MAG TPA: DUF5700 domain-containing putative Zn-dependent protease, partial [Bacteroidota bacterium]|nr:DUF5700 domain-containing putative Zn-dependent protease [Bacteroidota bacterium]